MLTEGWQGLEHELQVLVGREAVGPGRLDQAVDCRAGLGTARCVAEQPVLAVMETLP